MTARTRLPNRRLAETFQFEVGGINYVCTVGRFHDGRVAEIFLSNCKSNSTADVNARDAAIAASLALQFGADVETIRKAVCRDGQGRASGPLGTALDRLAAERSGEARDR
jgi:UDP-N-acetylmuramyl tripeptide synthase